MTVSAAQSNDNFLPAPVRVLAPYYILVLVVFAAYINIFDNAFLYDDDLLIQLNEYLRGWSHIGDILTSLTQSGAHYPGGYYRPLQILLYLFAFHMGDGSPFFFHLLNLLLHLANTCFVYKIGTKLGFKPWGVFFAALIWGAHPLHTEAVTFMSATADPLFAFFCLWAIIVLLPDISPRKILQIIPLFLLGLLSKETMAMFPLLVVACLFLTSSQRLSASTYFRTWPLWVIALMYGAWRIHDIGYLSALQNNAISKIYADHPLERIYTFFATLPTYLGLIIWPHNLHMDWEFPLYGSVWFAPVVAGLGMGFFAAAQIIRSSKKPNRGIEMSWGLLWFAAAYAPNSGILVPINYVFAEHCMYLPLVGLFLGLAETIEKLLQNRLRSATLACAAAALVFAGVMSAKTYEQNAIWHDPISFYSNIFRFSGINSTRAHNNLAIYYVGIGDYANALEQYRKSIDLMDAPATRYNMAAAYLVMPNERAHIPDAIANLQRSLELDPTYYHSDKLLGDIYDNLGDKDKAKYYHDRADAILAQHQ
jgi:tetratricopeptide (TPR) repeat protein